MFTFVKSSLASLKSPQVNKSHSRILQKEINFVLVAFSRSISWMRAIKISSCAGAALGPRHLHFHISSAHIRSQCTQQNSWEGENFVFERFRSRFWLCAAPSRCVGGRLWVILRRWNSTVDWEFLVSISQKNWSFARVLNPFLSGFCEVFPFPFSARGSNTMIYEAIKYRW